jgi:uncharacterized protein CbrC (UPF0167 family)
MSAFRYFLGPTNEMSGWVDRPVRCSFCGATCPGFSLAGATCPSLATGSVASAHGCASCLRAGRFEFWHDTEVGLLTEHGLEKMYKDQRAPSPTLRAESLLELRRTPQIVTWQQEKWLTHCDDFMPYLGTWRPLDFAQNAPDADARAMFLRMTREPRQRPLWDKMSIKPTDSEWAVTYYVFRCVHCNELAGYYDFA